ncbi:MAG: DUF885 domain-containing protein [Gemmataceae bacterium]
MRFRLASFALVLAAAPATAQEGVAALADEYYDALFDWDPLQATYAGIHDRDAKLPDLSAGNIARRREQLGKQFERVTMHLRARIGPAERIDLEILQSAIQSEIHELDVIRDWKRNPMPYLGKPAEGIDLLMKLSFAPPAERLRSAIGRLKMTPALIAAMKANVQDVPKEFADLGLIVAKGSGGFFKKDLPAWAKEAAGKDEKLLAEFEQANAAAAAAFDDAAAWIEKDLMPKARGRYAIGADAYLKKLQYDEMVEISMEKLLAVGEANLKRDQDAFAATAKKIDPKRTPLEVLAMITDDHPKPEDLVPATRGTIEKCRIFLLDKKIVSIPSEVRPTIAETPPFLRTGGFASMYTPGAYETKATEAFYYVTPPETEWDAKRKTEHMRLFNRSALEVLTIHEAYPGHYLQFLYAKQFPTKVRKLYACGSNAEGWAHYSEQMILDEGFADGDPKIRLAQLHDALLRDCRYIVGIKLHTAGWTVEQGKKFFMEQGYQEAEGAFQESRRGTYNPTYLYYTLGKLQILKLREDWKKAKGADYSLQKFHDEFIRHGAIPIRQIRKLMLGEAGESL